MKKVVHLGIVLAFLLALVPVDVSAHTEGDPLVVSLLAGQTDPIGEVHVWNDADTLYVKFISTGDCMLETHVAVGTTLSEIPQTKKGNPIPGQFEFSDPHACVNEYTYEIPLTWGAGSTVYIAAHAALGRIETMSFESNVGEIVYGPVYSNDMPTEWGTVGSAVRAYNWLGYTRDLSDPEQIPGCTTNPYQSLTWSWGFGLNPTYNPDIPGVIWISTAPNTEQWDVDSWRKFDETFEVPGYPIEGSIQVNADNYYVVSNGETIGSDDNIWNPLMTHTFYPVEGINTLEFITENWAQGLATNYCDQLGNPNGITYKGTVSYYADGETAWADGIDFPGRNWATYFTYNVQGVCPSIVGSSSNIELRSSPPEDIRVGQFESDAKVRIWEEFLGPLPADLEYDLSEGEIARINGPPTETPEITSGEQVCVYYVHLDNVGNSSTVQHTGYLEFTANILGLIISGGNLGIFAGRDLMFDADASIGYPGTTYPITSGVDYWRGFDVNYGSNLDDAVFNGNRVDFTMWVVNAHDSFRVILPALPFIPE